MTLYKPDCVSNYYEIACKTWEIACACSIANYAKIRNFPKNVTFEIRNSIHFCVLFFAHTHTDNSGTLPSTPDADDGGSKDEEGDLFSGAKDAETYQQSLLVKKSIQEMLGRRSGPRWSVPRDYIGEGIIVRSVCSN